MSWIVAAVLGALLVQRGAELVLARRNAHWLRAEGARFVRADGYGLIVSVHLLLFVLVAVETSWVGAHYGWWSLAGGVLFVAGQALRYHAITTLGRRWNTRVFVLPHAPLVRSGLYRFVPHPNYLGVVLELAGLPLVFGAWRTALMLGLLNGLALWRRIRIEERALGIRQDPASEGGTSGQRSGTQSLSGSR